MDHRGVIFIEMFCNSFNVFCLLLLFCVDRTTHRGDRSRVGSAAATATWPSASSAAAITHSVTSRG